MKGLLLRSIREYVTLVHTHTHTQLKQCQNYNWPFIYRSHFNNTCLTYSSSHMKISGQWCALSYACRLRAGGLLLGLSDRTAILSVKCICILIYPQTQGVHDFLGFTFHIRFQCYFWRRHILKPPRQRCIDQGVSISGITVGQYWAFVRQQDYEGDCGILHLRLNSYHGGLAVSRRSCDSRNLGLIVVIQTTP